MSWTRFREHCHHYPALGLSLDVSRMPFPDDFLASMEPKFAEAFAAWTIGKRRHRQSGRNRMVGHYWLRAPQLAPTKEIATPSHYPGRDPGVRRKVHRGEVAAPVGRFRELLVIGIGGSALGPQFVAQALGRLKGRRDRMRVHFFDNTDPDGMDVS